MLVTVSINKDPIIKEAKANSLTCDPASLINNKTVKRPIFSTVKEKVQAGGE